MYQPLSKLFVKNFSDQTSLKDIEDLFGQYGDIFDCKINNHANSFAVVVYRDKDAAEKAISSLHDSDNLGGRLSVEFTYKKSHEGRNEGNYRDQRQGDRQYRDNRGSYNDNRYGDRGYDNRGQGRYNDRGSDEGRQGNSRYENRGYDNRGQGRYERQYDDRRNEQRNNNGGYVPDDQKEEYVRNGLCFNCKQSGHFSRNCPQNFKGRSDGGSNRDRNRSRSAERKNGGYRRERDDSFKRRKRSTSNSD